MSDYEYEGKAEVVPLYMMAPGAAPVVKIGIRNLDAEDWVGEVLVDGVQLPDAATVTLRDADSKGVSRDGWSAKATTTGSPGKRPVLNGESAFHVPS